MEITRKVKNNPKRFSGVSEVQTTRDTLQGGPGWGCDRALWGGGVCSCDTLATHGGLAALATPWSATGGGRGVASAPLSSFRGENKGRWKTQGSFLGKIIKVKLALPPPPPPLSKKPSNPPPGRAKWVPFVLLAFFPLFYSNFWPNLRPIHVARPVVVLWG